MPRAKKSDVVQPSVNIGLVGHVDHGKTTLTQQLSGKWTDTHSEEIKRGITIRLGYADTTFVKTKDGQYLTEDTAKHDKKTYTVVRKVSFVDAPGHESLMATMLAGATIMDGALLLIASNESCPQPQTREHLMALEISGIKNIVVVQNKVDLVGKEQAMKNYQDIKAFLKGTTFENAPIIPISAQHGANIDVLIQAIEEHIPTPERVKTADPMFLIARSFDINRPGTDIDTFVGGVLGGSLIRGQIKAGEEIEIRPGYPTGQANNRVYHAIFTKVTDLKIGGMSVKEITPGGSQGLMTSLDPSIVKSDSLTGNVVGHKDKLPPVHSDFTLTVTLLDRVVGSADDLVVDRIKMHEPLMLNVNSAATVGIVTEMKKNKIHCDLKLPVCADVGSRVTISRRIVNRFRLIGYGIIE